MEETVTESSITSQRQRQMAIHDAEPPEEETTKGRERQYVANEDNGNNDTEGKPFVQERKRRDPSQ